MGKLLRNIGILLVPILLYYAVFIAFEPNNYFGLKEKADGTDIMATLRAYKADPGDAIILGDSRMAKFDPAAVAAATGHPWDNLAYGGASLKEQLDVLDWALAHNPGMTDVVFTVSFYTLNAGYNHDRQVVRAVDNPFAYLTNLGYNINMLVNLQDHLTGREVGGEWETMDPEDYRYVDYTDPVTGDTASIRTKMAEHLADLSPRSKDWKLNEEQLNRLLDTIKTCRANGVNFTVVLPPASGDVHRFLMDGYGIAPQMAPVVARLKASGALVLDYEGEQAGTLRDDQFYDGFHLDLERGLPQWTEELFTAIAAESGGGHGT